MSGLGRLCIERSGDDLDFVDDLAEGGKLVAFESLVENLLACARVEYPVVIVVIVVVDVVIPQYRMPSWNPCGILVRYPTHFERRAPMYRVSSSLSTSKTTPRKQYTRPHKRTRPVAASWTNSSVWGWEWSMNS